MKNAFTASLAAGSVALVVASASFAATSPVAGDIHVYRLLNGYNKETRGTLNYQVAAVEAGRVTVSVT